MCGRGCGGWGVGVGLADRVGLVRAGAGVELGCLGAAASVVRPAGVEADCFADVAGAIGLVRVGGPGVGDGRGVALAAGLAMTVVPA
ncbi:hypothetical protein FAIPA1_520003 [Frankia sp. AiPs1]